MLMDPSPTVDEERQCAHFIRSGQRERRDVCMALFGIMSSPPRNFWDAAASTGLANEFLSKIIIGPIELGARG